MFVLKQLSRLPLCVLYALTDALYVFVYHIWRFRRKLTLSNLANSFPDKPAAELESIARQSYRNAANMIAEVLKGATMSEPELRRRVRILNLGAIEELMLAGRSVVLLASHHCNWEWLLLTSGLELKFSIDAVYKPLRVAAIDRFMFETRSRFGGNPIMVKDFPGEVFRRRGSAHLFALVADQTPPQAEDKYWTPFLNQDTAFHAGADTVARITRSPVFFVGMTRLRRGYYEARLQLLAQPPYSGGGAEITERYVRVAEAHIAQHPADWLWMYRKWKYRKPIYA